MKKIQLFAAAFTLMFISAFALLPVATVGAQALDEICSDTGSDGAVCQNKDQSTDTFILSLINFLLYIIGAVAVVIMIIGGFLYATSSGNAASVSRAKNTILYAVIGLVISMIAYAVVNFVLDLF